MTNCPQCSNPLDIIDNAGLDCLGCGLFFNNAILQEWENAQIAINERESWQDWLSEQDQQELKAA